MADDLILGNDGWAPVESKNDPIAVEASMTYKFWKNLIGKMKKDQIEAFWNFKPETHAMDIKIIDPETFTFLANQIEVLTYVLGMMLPKNYKVTRFRYPVNLIAHLHHAIEDDEGEMTTIFFIFRIRPINFKDEGRITALNHVRSLKEEMACKPVDEETISLFSHIVEDLMVNKRRCPNMYYKPGLFEDISYVPGQMDGTYRGVSLTGITRCMGVGIASQITDPLSEILLSLSQVYGMAKVSSKPDKDEDPFFILDESKVSLSTGDFIVPEIQVRGKYLIQVLIEREKDMFNEVIGFKHRSPRQGNDEALKKQTYFKFLTRVLAGKNADFAELQVMSEDGEEEKFPYTDKQHDWLQVLRWVESVLNQIGAEFFSVLPVLMKMKPLFFDALDIYTVVRFALYTLNFSSTPRIEPTRKSKK